MTTMKICPFCGGYPYVAYSEDWDYPEGGIAWVECDRCGSRSKTYHFTGNPENVKLIDDVKERAIDAWNTRVREVTIK